jgi:ferredoxin/flavodoxin---NADP+ reductase
MSPIQEARWLAPSVRWIVVQAPRIAARHRAGHFVIVRVWENGERIPLTIADSDPTAGTITLVVQAVGATTHRMAQLQAGDSILDVVGPLGQPTQIKKVGHVVLVGGGVGTAVIHPQAKALRTAGNAVSAIIGGRSQPYVILENELKSLCGEVYPCTDDGSYGFHGFVTQRLEQLIKSQHVDEVITAGPVPMMRAVAEVTRPHGIHTVASLNPIMVDGTGMCGGCRVMVGSRMLFACVDGPEFDAHQVDFTELVNRLSAYREQERFVHDRLRQAEADHACRLDAKVEAMAAER